MRFVSSLFQIILLAFPRRFRDRFGEDMRVAFEERLSRCREEGWFSAGAHICVCLADAVINGLAERRTTRHFYHRTGDPIVTTLKQDFRVAFRTLRRRAGFATAVILTLAGGIGAATAMFSIVNAVLLRPLPYVDPEKLVMVFSKNLSPLADSHVQRGSAGALESGLSIPDLQDLRQAQSIEGFATITGFQPVLTGLGDAARINGAAVSPNFLSILGATPELGRDFEPDDNFLAGKAAVILSHGFWQRRLGGNSDMIGRTILLDRVAYRVAGVLPASFHSPDGENWELYRAVILRATPTNRGTRITPVLARIRTDTETARAELSSIAAALAAQYPATNKNFSVSIVPLTDLLPREMRRALWVLMGAVGLVLLIACANIANLFLVQAAGREREFAIRAAVGASRIRLVQQFLIESLVVSLIGGILGILLAFWGVQTIVALGPEGIPRLDQATVDMRVAGFAVFLTIVTALIFGLVPAGRAANIRRSRSTGILVAAQIALAIVLLIGTGLTLRSLMLLHAVDPGFKTAHLTSFYTSMTRVDFRSVQQSAALYRDIEAGLKTLPGVESVGATLQLPIAEHDVDLTALTILDRPPVPEHERPTSRLLIATPDYLKTMSVPLLQGRFFTDADRLDKPGVAIINEVLARRLWPDQSAIGKRVALDLLLTPGEKPEREIVGVVGNIKHFGLEFSDEPQMFLPHGQSPWPAMFFVVKSGNDPTTLARGFRDVLRSVGRDMPVDRIRTLDEVLAQATGHPRFRTRLISLFAVASMLLALIGIYGVISYSVARSFKDIGVRIAIGAEHKHIVRLVLLQGVKLTAGGATGGTIAALWLSRTLSGLLFGVGPNDPVIFAAAVSTCCIGSMLACYFPARRAVRIDPILAIRLE
jgi:putative ABC transport system permease protein